jgi:hypothetical protein
MRDSAGRESPPLWLTGQVRGGQQQASWPVRSASAPSRRADGLGPMEPGPSRSLLRLSKPAAKPRPLVSARRPLRRRPLRARGRSRRHRTDGPAKSKVGDPSLLRPGGSACIRRGVSGPAHGPLLLDFCWQMTRASPGWGGMLGRRFSPATLEGGSPAPRGLLEAPPYPFFSGEPCDRFIVCWNACGREPSSPFGPPPSPPQAPVGPLARV